MSRLYLTAFFMLLLGGLVTLPQAQAAPKGKLNKAAKERLVLMPLRLGEQDQQLQGAMEMALVKGLQQKYEVFFGEQVAKKAREIFMKESKNTAHKECDETRCLQGIAESFQAELLATANITKQSDGYFIALSIQNLFDNKIVQSESVPCKGCDAYAVVDKLKELSGAQIAPVADNPEPMSGARSNDPETMLWNEVKSTNSIDDYQTYMGQYPKGKYLALAKSHVKKLQEEAANETLRKEQQAWQTAEQAGGEADYQSYLNLYPQGRYAAIAQVRIRKLQTDLAAREEQALWQTVQSSEDVKAVQGYLDRYPNGSHAVVARGKLPLLEEDGLWKRSLATASRAGMQAYIEKYPNGRYVAQARQKDEEYQRTPPKPKLPFDLGEDVWHAVETSPAYLNWPRQKTVKVSYQGSKHMEYTGSKSSSLTPPPDSRKDGIVEWNPLSDKCAKVRTKNEFMDIQAYICGAFLALGSMSKEGKNDSFTKSVDEISGSLFPMRIGAKMSLRYQNAYVPNRQYDSISGYSCEVAGQEPARELHTRLTGTAWRVHCQQSMFMNGKTTFSSERDDYYLEDLGVFMSQVGQLDMSRKRFVLPVPGSQTVIVAEGDYGSRSTTTYDSYDWSVGE